MRPVQEGGDQELEAGLGDEQEKGKGGEEENEVLERVVEVDEFSVANKALYAILFFS